MNELLLLYNDGQPIPAIGKVFFSDTTSDAQRKELIELLLDSQEYEQLCGIIHCGNIVKQYHTTDYVLSKESASFDLEAAYFSLFIDLIETCKVSQEKVMPMIFSSAACEKNTCLRAWQTAIKAYLTKLAYKNFDYVADRLVQYDKKLLFLSVLMRVDRSRAITKMLEMALYGKSFNKTALRKFLRGYENDVIAYIRPIYGSLKTRQREAAVRLLLLYKNSVPAAILLEELAENEKSVTIKNLIINDAAVKPKGEKAEVSSVELFFDAMLTGRAFPLEAFRQLIATEEYRKVAEQLFYGVYNDSSMCDIVVVEQGKINNLDNQPVELQSDCAIKVLHPVELPARYAYLKQLNITQPFDQIRRKVFEPSQEEKQYYTCTVLKGTLVNAPDLKKNFTRCGFRVLNRDIDGACTQAGLLRDGILCVLDFSPVDLRRKENVLVTVGEVRFYAYSDTVKLNGQIYVDGVPMHSVAEIGAREYSEFMYSVYEALGQI